MISLLLLLPLAPHLVCLSDSQLMFLQNDFGSKKVPSLLLFYKVICASCCTDIVPCVAYHGSQCSSESSCTTAHPHAASLPVTLRDPSTATMLALFMKRFRFHCVILLTTGTYDFHHCYLCVCVFWSPQTYENSLPRSDNDVLLVASIAIC